MTRHPDREPFVSSESALAAGQAIREAWLRRFPPPAFIVCADDVFAVSGERLQRNKIWNLTRYSLLSRTWPLAEQCLEDASAAKAANGAIGAKAWRYIRPAELRLSL
jgi:hypothetical protein